MSDEEGHGASIAVTEFLIDDANEDKLWSHGLSREALYQVLMNRRIVNRNRRGRAAKHLLTGRDHSGRCIAIPIIPTHDPSVWRPVSARFCKRSEAARLR